MVHKTSLEQLEQNHEEKDQPTAQAQVGINCLSCHCHITTNLVT